MKYNIIKFGTIDSTNDYAKEIGANAKEGTVIVAKEQTKGRGRLGRIWESPKDKGLYFSIILKPNNLQHIQNLTLISSLAIYRALKELNIVVQIKWPNDIVKDNKKIAGILTEIKFNGETIDYIVVGIGININSTMEKIPEYLQHKATSLNLISNDEVDESKLLYLILEEFATLYEDYKLNGLTKEMIEVIKENSSILNKEIQITKGNSTRTGMPVDINSKGELVVKFDEVTESLNSGEISLKNMYSWLTTVYNGYILYIQI